MHYYNRFDSLGPNDPGFVSLSEGDPESPDQEMTDDQEEQPDYMDIDCSFNFFVRSLNNSLLPGDGYGSGPFDNRFDFSLGDPGVDYEGTHKCEYATSGAAGEPHWPQIFQYLLLHFAHIRFFNTVFVLVDNRDLTAPRTDQESLAHWPTVEAWWISRLGMYGPAGELCDLIYIPIGASAGLEHVHPT